MNKNAKFEIRIAKSIISLVLIFAMAFVMLACDYEIVIKPKDDTSADTSTESNPDSDEIVGAPDTSEAYNGEYSELLQNVITNDYYNSLIDSARGGNHNLYTSGKFQPHPYAFLEDEGFDIEAIENMQLDCYTMSYVLDEEPNNLYMYTRVNDGSVVHNYLLKYELTDQEMKDYDMTHNAPNSTTNYYIQAVFMNNEISEMKTPTIVGTSKMTVKAFSGMAEAMENTYIQETKCDIIMINPDPKNYYFNLKLIPYYYEDKHMVFSTTIVNLDCKASIGLTENVYTKPYTLGSFNISSSHNLNVRLYLTQRANLNLERCKDMVE